MNRNQVEHVLMPQWWPHMNWPPGGFPKREDTTKLILKTTGAGTKPDPKIMWRDPDTLRYEVETVESCERLVREVTIERGCTHAWIIKGAHATASKTLFTREIGVGSDKFHITARLGTRNNWVNLTLHLYVKFDSFTVHRIIRKDHLTSPPNPHFWAWGQYPRAYVTEESQEKPWENQNNHPITPKQTQGEKKRLKKQQMS